MAASIVKIDVDTFLEKGYGCKHGPEGGQCSNRFTKGELISLQDYFLEMTNEEKDLFVKSVMLTQKEPSEQKYLTYKLYGKRLCRETFLFIINISKTKLLNITKHYDENGMGRRRHGNKGPSNTIPFDAKVYVKRFIQNFAVSHGVLLPGRIPGYRDQSISLIQSSETKKSVWKFYCKSCETSDIVPVKYTLFTTLWKELIPWVVICKPLTDLCWTCQSNNNLIIKSANKEDVEKRQKVIDQLAHLEWVKREQNYHKLQCQLAEENCSTHNIATHNEPCSADIVNHYSWDFAQQLHCPTDPMQPGPIYFKVPRKCLIFGICNDGINVQHNYLIDEALSTGKGGNAVISYCHHYFEKHGLGEKSALIHADNAVGKSK